MNLADPLNKVSDESIVQIWLDSYDEMFSDFDPRPYSKRMWSDDFIFQIKKVIKDHRREVKVFRILLPATEKNERIERTVADRLTEFLVHRKLEILAARKKAISNGIYYILMGTIVIISYEYINRWDEEEFSWHVLLGVLEPLGWFLVWLGLDTLMDSRKTNQDLGFFDKLASAKIEFAIY